MHIATVAIDLAKSVFELAAADETGRVVERRRLSRSQFERYFDNRVVARVVMEACGTAHYWARRLIQRGIEVSLLPRTMCEPMSGGTKQIVLMRRRCWRHLGPLTSFRSE